jgi:hypothetical protein
MAERMGANGSPIQKKVVTWEESQETLQEILEVNPNSSPVEIEEVEIEEVEIEEDFDEDLDEEEDDE